MKHIIKLCYKIIASVLIIVFPAYPALVFGFEKVGPSVLIGMVPWIGGIWMRISEIYLFLFEVAVLFIFSLFILMFLGAGIYKIFYYIWNFDNK